MIRVHCDICGEEIGEPRKKDPTYHWHTCAKCDETLRLIDIPGLVKDTVMAMRADAPKPAKGPHKQRTVRFVP